MDFISFGPCCLSAELLKALNIRSCTYGFDWSRSGSLEHKDFLKLGAHEFFQNFVKRPVLRLQQISTPYKSLLKTSELKRATPLYGYPYTYNPHRNLDCVRELEYLERCYHRLDRKIFDSLDKPVTILLSDYTNKPGYTHFKEPSKAAIYLLSCFQLFKQFSPTIRIIRYTIVDNISEETVAVSSMATGDILNVKIPEQIDGSKDLRREYYRRLYPLFL